MVNMQSMPTLPINILERYTAQPDMQYMRLDAALGRIFPHFGLRARRRLWKEANILVNGKPQKNGFLLNAGDLIEVIAKADFTSGQAHDANFWLAQIHIVQSARDYIALFKPSGLASAHINGSRQLSVEGLLGTNWTQLLQTAGATLAGDVCEKDQYKSHDDSSKAVPLLCNRLDTPTSGLLTLANSATALKKFKELEAEGKIEKFYFALVKGEWSGQEFLQEALKTDNRHKTTVQPAGHGEYSAFKSLPPFNAAPLNGSDETPDAADPLRFTRVIKSVYYPDGFTDAHGNVHYAGSCSLLTVMIKKGARHQIRVHLQHAGHSIVGDTLYGDAFETDSATIHAKKAGRAALNSAGQRLYLHHFKLVLPGFEAEALPDWL